MKDDTPKIYVADLKSYNEGNLVGEWIDLSEYNDGSEVQEKITELMEEYSEKYHDGEETEHAIHDYENFDSSLYSEYMGESEFDTIISAYKILDDYPELNMEVITEIMSDYNLEGDEVVQWIDERYVGKFDSDEDLGYNFVEMVGGIENVSNSDFYFDYEKLGRDLSINDYTQYGGVYFQNYKHGGKVKNTPRYSYAHGGKIGDLRIIDIEWRQLSDKGIGRYYLTENDVEKLEDEYGATYYFDYYDDSDDMKMRTPYSKMKMILDQEMKDKGLMDSYFEKGGYISNDRKLLIEYIKDNKKDYVSPMAYKEDLKLAKEIDEDLMYRHFDFAFNDIGRYRSLEGYNKIYAKGGELEVGKNYQAKFSNKFNKRVLTDFKVVNKFKGRDDMPMVEIITENGERANVFEKDLKPLMLD